MLVDGMVAIPAWIVRQLTLFRRQRVGKIDQRLFWLERPIALMRKIR